MSQRLFFCTPDLVMPQPFLQAFPVEGLYTMGLASFSLMPILSWSSFLGMKQRPSPFRCSPNFSLRLRISSFLFPVSQIYHADPRSPCYSPSHNKSGALLLMKFQFHRLFPLIARCAELPL